jgi:predicted DNA-binding protein (MmcQ/YjbR family)
MAVKKTKGPSVLDHMREICLALPETKETLTWGQPHFRVNDKIFAGGGEEDGKTVIGFKLEMEHADAVVQDARFWRAPYVGHKGWVSMDANQVEDWAEVQPLVLERYRLIAPKRTLAHMGAGVPVATAAPRRRAAGAKAKSRAAAKPPTRGRRA